jgi:hypothetical protein
VGAHHTGAAVVDDVREVVRRQAIVDGNQHRTDLRNRVKRLELRVRVRRDVDDAVTLLDAERLQGG